MFCISVAASAQVPSMINYQGRLVDDTNLVSGNVELELNLYDAATDGNLLYSDSNTVTVVDGLYSTYIGDNTVFGTLDDALTNTMVYLEPVVNGTALSPRERFVSVPYAAVAETVRGTNLCVDAASGNVGVGTGTAFPESKLTVNGAVQAWNTGSTFVRWGCTNAPTNAVLVYSGHAFAGRFDYAGTRPFIMQPGELSEHMCAYNNTGRFSPLSTLEWHLVPDAGISNEVRVVGCVCLANGPVVTVWGTHTPPDGWDVLYRGYAVSTRYDFSGTVGPILLECDEFDGTAGARQDVDALVWPTKIYNNQVPDGYTGNYLVPGVLCVKVAGASH